MQFAVSRNREYLADASGVQMTRYPPGLISALKKLEDDHTSVHTSSKATAHLWIEEPLDKESNKGHTKWNHLFDTHPPIDDRIHALEAHVAAKLVLSGGRCGAIVLHVRRARRVRGGVRRRQEEGRRPTRPRPTTTKPAPPIAPLTGVADPGGASLKRCAVTVKIDNTLAGHPKYGVEPADVVYEEVVEGGITRLAAIFNSHAPDRVGRCARYARPIRASCGRSAACSRTRRRAVRDRRRSTPRRSCSSTRAARDR